MLASSSYEPVHSVVLDPPSNGPKTCERWVENFAAANLPARPLTAQGSIVPPSYGHPTDRFCGARARLLFPWCIYGVKRADAVRRSSPASLATPTDAPIFERGCRVIHTFSSTLQTCTMCNTRVSRASCPKVGFPRQVCSLRYSRRFYQAAAHPVDDMIRRISSS